MKRYILFALMALPVIGAQAQDTYLNDRATNTSDVIGTARYVGMGGAMGALGADISAISNNPASIGLMRRGMFAFTLGGQINDAKPAYGDSRGSFTFDQIGFVFPFGDVGDETRLNFAFNYQKKINYNQGIFTRQNLGGLSQGDMFAWIANSTYKEGSDGFYFDSPFYDNLYTAGFFSEFTNTAGDSYFRNINSSETGIYYRNSSGSLQAYDFNLSGSVSDRWFWGLTFGIDHMIYTQSASYEEIGDDSYILYQDQKLKGYGLNVKAGAIIRPFEDSPFRFGLTVETPTWNVLRHTALAGLSVLNEQGNYTKASYMNDDNYLEYNVYTPWKFRFALGSTVGDYFAWDTELEYALIKYTKMGYPDNSDYYDYDGSAISMNKDRAMNEMTQTNMDCKGGLNWRFGFEVKPIPQLAIRGGYNIFGKPFKKGARLDQTCNTPAYDWSTSTEYINLRRTNLFTLGIGYQGKHFFADLAYKYRVQRGDFYAFDDHFTSLNESFIFENPNLAGKTLQPTEVNLDRHNIAVTLGYRF